MSNILLLGDITGKSRVAVRMLTDVLEARGHEVLSLPTALVSNTLNLGKAEILDTTDYLLRSLALWRELGVSAEFLCIGYITGSAQAAVLARVADDMRANGVPVLVDPILGDSGRKYNSVTEDQVEGMRRLCRHADLITPNLTEAKLLTGLDAPPQELAHLLGEGKRSVLITSCPGEDDAHGAIVGFDAGCAEDVCVPFARVPGHHFGTGDRFSALLVDALVCGCTLAEAARCASEGVREALRKLIRG